MGKEIRNDLIGFFWAAGILLNLLAALGAPYPGLWVLVGVVALSIGAGLYWAGQQR